MMDDGIRECTRAHSYRTQGGTPMLESLHIENIAVIKSVDIDFPRAFAC